MPKTIVDIDPREMSFIFSEYKGEKWSPVNDDARVIALKGEKATGFAEKVKSVIDTLKALAGVEAEADADYTETAKAILYAAADMNRANDLAEPARSAAIKAAVDAVVKAGARHSATDMREIDGIAQAVNEINIRLAALGVGQPSGETPIADEPQDNPNGADTPGDGDGDADDVMAVAPDDQRGTGEVKADIQVSDDDGSPDITEVIKAQAEAIITAKAVEFQQQIDAVKAESQSQIDALKAQSESRAAELVSQLQAATKRAEEAERVVKAVVGEARKPSSPGFVPTRREDGRVDDPAAADKAEMLENIPAPSKIADVIKLQRIVNQ